MKLRENPIGIQLKSNFVPRIPSNLNFKFLCQVYGPLLTKLYI